MLILSKVKERHQLTNKQTKKKVPELKDFKF